MNVRTRLFVHALFACTFSTTSMEPKSRTLDRREINALLWSYELDREPIAQLIPYLKKYACRKQIDWTDRHGRTFLHLAAAKGDVRFIEILIIGLGANWEQEDAQGKTPLAIAQESFCQAEEKQEVYERFDDCVNYLSDPEKCIETASAENVIPKELKEQCSIQ